MSTPSTDKVKGLYEPPSNRQEVVEADSAETIRCCRSCGSAFLTTKRRLLCSICNAFGWGAPE
jgi:hypothetical protein